MKEEIAVTTLQQPIEDVTEGLNIREVYSDNIEVNRSYIILKRVMDITLSIMGLVLLSPLLIIVFLVIKSEDVKSPAIFKQTRVGKDGKEFTMYKFRSMKVNAEAELIKLIEFNEVSGAMFKMKNDPRITKIGRIIRKTSIDELPQLLNVIKGDMSLVGPRPALPREVKLYSMKDMERLLVIPGCTGLWQVSGRSNLSFEQMVELDLKYINNLSIKEDLLIIFKTFKVILIPQDAY